MAHEDLSRGEILEVSSNRTFGLVFAAFFALLGLWPLVRHNPYRPWALALSGMFLAVALLVPGVLQPLNYIWVQLASALHKVMNPVATGLIFFLAFLPMAMILRFLKKDLLRLSFEKDAQTYWIPRQRPGPATDSMTRQF